MVHRGQGRTRGRADRWTKRKGSLLRTGLEAWTGGNERSAREEERERKSLARYFKGSPGRHR